MCDDNNIIMKNFADRLIGEIQKKGNPCMVGLDPRLDQIPNFIPKDNIEDTLFEFNKIIIEQVADLIPAVKLQFAFYIQHGLAGINAFKKSIDFAKEKGLIVVIDAKSNDIGSTAEAYANAFLGNAFNADALTVSPFLGRDSIEPFIKMCRENDKGIFILVKTSNPGSGDFQNLILKGSEKAVYINLATMVDELGNDLIGETGYSAIGAVVGATYPQEASILRALMPKAIFLVPGYGVQGGTAEDTVPCFNVDKLGATVHSSRGIIFTKDLDISKEDYKAFVRANTEKMIADINSVLK
jgi:orotidine-5'-phosphate decarboxylase